LDRYADAPSAALSHALVWREFPLSARVRAPLC
jgi:hypothetical protein